MAVTSFNETENSRVSLFSGSTCFVKQAPADLLKAAGPSENQLHPSSAVI